MSQQTLPIFVVDAFADQPFTGNPAAVIPLQSWLPDSQLQAIAQENNLSETAFFTPFSGSEADYELRWFTPTVEVPLCGHATLASGHVLFNHLGFENPNLRFRTRQRGVLRLHRTDTGAYAMGLPATDQSNREIDPELGVQLGLTILEMYEGDFLTLVLPSPEAVAAYSPPFNQIKELGRKVIITAKGGSGQFAEFDFVSRMFRPAIGIDEDPVTGAAHAQIVPYWSLVLQKTDLSAAQIGPRGGRLRAIMKGECVELQGQARTYMAGKIFL